MAVDMHNFESEITEIKHVKFDAKYNRNKSKYLT